MRCHETLAIYAKGKAIINKVKIDKIERDSVVDTHRLVTDMKRMLTGIKQ
jgi:hypothetical protein